MSFLGTGVFISIGCPQFCFFAVGAEAGVVSGRLIVYHDEEEDKGHLIAMMVISVRTRVVTQGRWWGVHSRG